VKHEEVQVGYYNIERSMMQDVSLSITAKGLQQENSSLLYFKQCK